MRIPWQHALVPRQVVIDTGYRGFHLPEIMDNGAHSIVVVVDVVCVISMMVVVVMISRLNGVASPCTRCTNHIVFHNFVVVSKSSCLAQAS